MEEDGKTLPDLDPKNPDGSGFSPPRPHIGTAAQTPPPVSASDAPTLIHLGSLAPGSAASVPPPDYTDNLTMQLVFQPGTILAGRYRLLRVLGEGGMGAVYQARDQELDRLIALKVIRPELAGHASILQRFKQELILARHVTHKNVVRIYDLGEADGVKFITMEYVDGEDLRSLLRRQQKLSPNEAVDIVIQICRALDCAHGEGVIHRDLKPQNVMRDSQGRVVVMDFGLARSLESPGMTQTGALVGTLEYMSPEQALGSELDQRSDLFAVGLIFYELLTGKVPYKADTGIASLMKRTQQRAVPISDIDGTVPKALSAIVSKCLERDPAHRYASALELLRQLEAWQGNPNLSVAEPIHAPTTPRSVQISLALPGRRGWIWIAVVAAVVITSLSVPRIRQRIFPSSQISSNRGIPDLSKGKYVAILPLKVLGDENSLRYVADGLVEALSAKMFQLQEVHVASSSAVEKAAAKEQPIQALAKSLGVNLVLQGTVQGSGDRLRITLDLDDVSSGRRVWAKEFPGVSQDLLTLEDQIYGDLVDALELKPSSEEMARTGVHPTENMAAYDLYLKGRNALRGGKNPADTQAAIKILDSALQQDANFALAYAGLADANLLLYKETKDPIYAQKALAASQTAANLNPNLPEVHLAMGSVYSAMGRNAEAVGELQNVLKLTPNSDEASSRLGSAYLAAAKKDEAIAAYQAAVSQNPYYWLNYNKLAGAYTQLGEYDKALAELKRVIELAPDNPVGYENTAAIYIRQARYGEAIPALEKAVQVRPDAINSSNLGTAYFYAKRYNDSVKMFEQAVQQNPRDQELTGNLADAYRWSGHADKAAETYDKAIKLAFDELQVNPKSANVTADLALYYAKKGDAGQAQVYIRQARGIDPDDVQLLYDEAQVYAVIGKQNEALKSLKEAFHRGYSPGQAQNDPELDKLRALPEFSKLVTEYSSRKSN